MRSSFEAMKKNMGHKDSWKHVLGFEQRTCLRRWSSGGPLALSLTILHKAYSSVDSESLSRLHSRLHTADLSRYDIRNIREHLMTAFRLKIPCSAPGSSTWWPYTMLKVVGLMVSPAF